ncbi:Scr1 family TA system antitoxin-like transcriptional regulator [Micromonospora musae]|uniref:helix-turn-helix domain-containing protein n=1 Tax=Micromonospora musae TaxID=1894970 RepID=UPI0034146B46
MARSLAAVSPLARRMRLGAAVRRLRGDTSASELARRAGLDRTVVSKVEAGERRTSLDTVLRLLDVLSIEQDEYQQLLNVARSGTETGWWNGSRYASMGERQAKTADLECGATVREYQTSMLPGLLQTEAYARHRAQVAIDKGAELDLEATVRGRLRRQEEMFSEGGAGTYEVFLEPQAIWRRPVPPDVMREQLLHLHRLATESAKVRVRILPVDARLADGWVPRNPFAVYQYADPGDLTLVAVDTVNADLVYTAPKDTADYAQMYEELRAGALSVEDSAALIQKAAGELAADA